MSVELLGVEPSKEEIILRAVKTVLTKVIRDTAVEPGMIHPLATSTREDIRHCFVLITERERELATNAGRPMMARPHFKDESRPASDTVVPISSIKRPPRDQGD
ncbi:conserved hypothetical protein [Gammaproteobacteria bacterium]